MQGFFSSVPVTPITGNGYISTFTPSYSVRGVSLNSTGSHIYLEFTNGTSPSPQIGSVKLNAASSIIWQKNISNAGGTDTPVSLEIDSNENTFYVGFDYTTSISDIKGYVVKYNSSGGVEWQRSLDPSTNNTVRWSGSSLDSTGNLFVTGYYNNTANSYAAFAKYSTSGALTFQKRDVIDTEYNDCMTDSSGNVYVSGFKTSGTNNGCFNKFDNSGSLVWGKTISSGSNSYTGSLSKDNTGNIYLGYHVGTTSAIIKFDTTGNVLYQKNSSTIQTVSAMGVDSSNNIYFASRVSGPVSIITKMDSTGTIVWQRSITVSGGTLGLDSNVFWQDGYIYVGGAIQITGTNNGILLKLIDTGAFTGTYGSYTITSTSYTFSTSSYTISNSSPTISTLALANADPALSSTSTSKTVSIITL